MFIDTANIYVKSGNGGNGAVSFRREKYVPKGGPDGGDAGRGGDVIFEADSDIRTLMDFRYKRKYVAENGEDGGTNNCHGRDGSSLIIKIPKGTLVKDAESQRIIADLTEDGQKVIVARGGRGGRGNTRFKNSTRQAPNFAEPGQEGEEMNIGLELKLLADVGLIGFPNVGKSTILSMVTAAKPKIADYHFTTLTPNLGVVELSGGKSFVLADIPGLIEGAHEGSGLGFEFLKHVERTKVLIHVVDISGIEGRDPIDDFDKINGELKMYNPELVKKMQVVAANKSDITGSEKNFIAFEKEMKTRGIKVFKVSAATNSNLKELMYYVSDMLDKIPEEKSNISLEQEYFKLDDEKDSKGYEIKIENNKYVITGSYVDRLFKKFNINDSESLRYFEKAIQKKGIIDELKQMGAKEGDTIKMNDFEFDFVE